LKQTIIKRYVLQWIAHPVRGHQFYATKLRFNNIMAFGVKCSHFRWT